MATVQTAMEPGIRSTYREPPQAPPVFSRDKDSLIREAKAVNKKTKTLLDEISRTFTPETATFLGVSEAIARDYDHNSIKTRLISFYRKVSPDPEMREYSRKADDIINEFDNSFVLRQDIFALVQALYDERNTLGLDEEQIRLVRRLRQQYIAHGLTIPAGADRDRFTRISARLQSLQAEYRRNINEENGCLWLTAEELLGVPDDVVSNLERGFGDNEGKLRLTFKYPHVNPTVEYAKNPETRKRVFVANDNKLVKNAAVFKETLALRDEAARLLGFENHAERKLDGSMAKSPKVVQDLLDDLRAKLVPGAQKELDQLKRLKAQHCKKYEIHNDGEFYVWDRTYYKRILLEESHKLDQLRIAEYLPLGKTVAGMLKMFETVMGLVFVKLDDTDLAGLSPTGRADDVKWHKDNIVYSAWEDDVDGGTFLGYLYMDLHPRQGKYNHQLQYNLQPGFTLNDGTRHYPSAALICNYTFPTPGKPSLLRHHEVVNLFHELGHAIHNLTSKTRYCKMHGTAGSRDFVEIPSQMLEHWCWTPSVLKSLSQHWETKAQMPDDLLHSLIASKNVNGALEALRELRTAKFDLMCHMPKSPEEAAALDPSVIYNEMGASIGLITGLEVETNKLDWGHAYANFSHWMGGMESSCYGYLYSQVYSTDMFYSVFKNDPMCTNQGRRYRHTVIEKGSTRDEMESLKEFLGREPSAEAFYKELGMTIVSSDAR